MNLNTPVSNRQFAKMVGQSEGAVRKAVARQSIVAGVVNGKIIPAKASEEWGKPILPEFGGGPVQVKPPIEKPPRKIPERRKPAREKIRREKPLPVTAEDWLQDDDEPLPAVTDEEIANEPTEFNENSSKIEADRRQSVYKAKMAELAYLEKKGDMIPFAKIDKLLFRYGSEIRTVLEALPAQIIDKIRSCDDRHAALRVLTDSMHDSLNILSDIQGREI